jgi:hypothetical protein
MKYLTACLILSSLFLVSCKKEEKEINSNESHYSQKNINITGYVFDSLSGNPINNLDIPYLACTKEGLEVAAASGAGQNRFSVYAMWNTKCRSDKPTEFYLGVNSQTYYYRRIIDLTPFEHGDTIHQNMLAIPYSTINVHITSNSADNLSIDCIQANCTGNNVDLGSYVDTIITRRIHSNHKLKIQLFSNGNLYSTTPYISQYGSTETIEIQYP